MFASARLHIGIPGPGECGGDLDPTNAAEAGQELTVTVRVSPQVGAEPSRITSIRLEVSHDDGAGWRPAVVTRNGPRWTVRIPGGTTEDEYASLRTTATDAAGNRVTETLIRAYRLS